MKKIQNVISVLIASTVFFFVSGGELVQYFQLIWSTLIQLSSSELGRLFTVIWKPVMLLSVVFFGFILLLHSKKKGPDITLK